VLAGCAAHGAAGVLLKADHALHTVAAAAAAQSKLGAEMHCCVHRRNVPLVTSSLKRWCNRERMIRAGVHAGSSGQEVCKVGEEEANAAAHGPDRDC
jgi:hypothetical protein